MDELVQALFERLVLSDRLQEITPLGFHLLVSFALRDVVGKEQSGRFARPGDGPKGKFHVESRTISMAVLGFTRNPGMRRLEQTPQLLRRVQFSNLPSLKFFRRESVLADGRLIYR